MMVTLSEDLNDAPAPPAPDLSRVEEGALVSVLQINVKRDGKWLGWTQHLDTQPPPEKTQCS